MTFFHDAFDDVWYWIFSYFLWILCLFFWQLKHFLMYVSTQRRIFENRQCCRKSCKVFDISKCSCNDSSWYFLIISLILFSSMISRFFFIKYCSFWSLSILSVAFISCTLADSESFLFILRMLLLINSFSFMWSFLRLKTFALSFSFSDVY